MSDMGPSGVADDGAAGLWDSPDSSAGVLDGFDTIESAEFQADSVAGDLGALIDEGWATDDAGARLNDSEIAAFLDVSQREVSEAGHEFRGDAQGEFGMPEYRQG